ncbi:YggN family protein [Flavobacterium sp. W21_SRS_FM6]|uniref:YggN family protein n=1 Tax=Flavobacterium sp. W21_SRS_FM6 TaxID=3240268 RepID=UPI003F915B44
MAFRFLLLCCFCGSAYADLDCEVALNFGLVINQQQIRVIDNSRTVYQINGDSQLMVGGHWIELHDEHQQQNLAELAKGLHLVVPKMILLANEGVELAVDTVEQVYSGLMGKDHKSQQKLQASLERVQKSVREKFIHANDTYYMGPGRLENVDDFVDRELEEQIEHVMSTSVGGILSAIGGLVASEQNTEQKVDELAQKLEDVGNVIERNVVPKAQSLKQKAEWFCNKFKELDRVEENLRQNVPELKAYNILNTSSNTISIPQ